MQGILGSLLMGMHILTHHDGIIDEKTQNQDEGEEGRFRKFTREEIQARGDNLDITWLRDESVERAEDLPEPDEIAAEILTHLQTATAEIETLMELLEPPVAEREASK